MTPQASSPLATSRRLVVKIGSSILVDEARGEIRRDWLDALTDDVARLHKGNCEVVLVSSGAIRLGRTHLKLAPRRRARTVPTLPMLSPTAQPTAVVASSANPPTCDAAM